MSFQYGQPSDDGRWWWDGYQWQPVFTVGQMSDDGTHTWDGNQWQPNTVAAPASKGSNGRLFLILGAAAGGLLLLIVLIAAIGGDPATTAGKPAGPGPTVTVTAPGPTVTMTAQAPAAKPAPAVTVTETGSAPDQETGALALELTWQSQSAADKRSMCALVATDPDTAWLSFSEGATNTTRETFDAFFAKACS